MAVISRNKFCKILNDLRDECQAIDKVSDVIHEYRLGVDNSFELLEHDASTIIELLEVMFDDTDGWISYYAYECRYDFSNFVAYNSDGSTFEICSPEDLWDYLVGKTHNS